MRRETFSWSPPFRASIANVSRPSQGDPQLPAVDHRGPAGTCAKCAPAVNLLDCSTKSILLITLANHLQRAVGILTLPRRGKRRTHALVLSPAPQKHIGAQHSHPWHFINFNLRAI